ncbi:MAG: hypothetical protein QG641_1191 [Candidatus Poribacteria bacterium]|nr:hypothetical protein [Candidatus Poribacteria bacterium]
MVNNQLVVIPAQAGIHLYFILSYKLFLDSSFRWNDIFYRRQFSWE